MVWLTLMWLVALLLAGFNLGYWWSSKNWIAVMSKRYGVPLRPKGVIERLWVPALSTLTIVWAIVVIVSLGLEARGQ